MAFDNKPPAATGGIAVVVTTEQQQNQGKIPEEDMSIRIIENRAGHVYEYYNMVLVFDYTTAHHVMGVAHNLRTIGTVLCVKTVKVDNNRNDAIIVEYINEDGALVREEEIARRNVVNILREHYPSVVLEESGKRMYQVPKPKQQDTEDNVKTTQR